MNFFCENDIAVAHTKNFIRQIFYYEVTCGGIEILVVEMSTAGAILLMN